MVNSQEIVGYFNSDPMFYPKREILRNGKVLGIVGGGNVALDIARVVLQPELLAETDVNSG